MIELGDLRPGSETSRPAGVRPEFDRRAVRQALLVLVTVLTLLGVTGAVRPEPHLIRVLWTMPIAPGDHVMTMAGAIYTIDGDEGGRLAAYDLATGAVRWSRPNPGRSAWLVDGGAPAVLLVPADQVTQQYNTDDGGSYLTDFYGQTLALDPRTGAELWRRPGEPYATTGDLAVLAEYAGEDAAGLHRLSVVGVHDGSVRWSLPGRGLEDLAFGGPDPANPSLLVTIVAGGATRVLRLGDGRPVAQGRVDLPDRPEFVDAFGDGRRLYVRAVGGGGDTLTAYDLHTLRRIWRVTGMVRVAAYLCGPAVCGVRPDGVAALDPAGGRVLWQTPALENAMPIMPGWVGVNEGSMDRYALIQAATGRRIGGLSGAVVAAPDGSGAFLLRDTVNPPDRTAVNRIDTASGTVALRGTIDRIGEQGCLAATANRLACTTRDARLMVVSVPG